MNLENIGQDCPCYEVDCSDIMFDIGEFCGLPPNNGKLTIQVNGSTVGDFSANQQEDETINITTPTSQDNADAVAGEALLRQQADNTLQANIDAEELARQRADREIQAVLDGESLARVNGDKNLQSQIDAIAVVDPIIKPFEAYHYYVEDSVITNNGTLCFAKQTFTSGGSFNANDWDISDFAQEQADWNESSSSAKSFIKNIPNLATVATSGSYNDLSDKPNLATVATSGSYNDLSNKPSILTANDIYPVNSVRILADTADHSTDFGQTWVRYGSGRVLVGYDSTQPEFNSIGKTGGNKTHTHGLTDGYAKLILKANGQVRYQERTVTAWTDNYYVPSAGTGGFGSDSQGYGANLDGSTNAGSSLQPYIVVSFWRRTK